MSQQEESKKDGISSVINHNSERIYQVTENGKVGHSLSISDTGWVRLKDGDNEIAKLRIDRDRRLQNIGGHEQYQYVLQPVDIHSNKGIMEVYKKIKEQKFSIYGPDSLSAEQKAKAGKLITDFLDNYIFKPESRTVLNEPKKDNREQSNSPYLQTREQHTQNI